MSDNRKWNILRINSKRKTSFSSRWPSTMIQVWHRNLPICIIHWFSRSTGLKRTQYHWRRSRDVLFLFSIFVIMQQPAFTYHCYFSKGRSIITTQRTFRTRFNTYSAIPMHGHQLLRGWTHSGRVQVWQSIGSRGHWIARSPENIERMPESFLQISSVFMKETCSCYGRDWPHYETKFSPKS